MLKFLCLVCFALIAMSQMVSFRNTQVLSFHVNSTVILSQLESFEESGKIDIWNDKSDGKLDVAVAQIHLGEFVTFLKKHSISWTVMIKDLQEEIDREASEMAKVAPYNAAFDNADEFFDKFRTYDEINAWLNAKITQYPNLAAKITIGKSFEKRDINGVKIHNKATQPKKSILFHGAIHAREWIAPTTVMWIANELLSKYASDPLVKKLVDNYEFHVFPVLNVDGYSFTHTSNRMWRKTRTPNQGSTCMGTDPNRNWSFKYRSGGSSDSPCSETYHGKSAFSEIENKQMSDYGRGLKNLVGYIDYHAYGQLVMRPWGWTRALSDDEAKLKKIGDETALKIGSVRGKTYRSGPFATILYVGSGTTVDYFYGNLKVNAYCIELGTSFTMPINEIRPIGKENFEGFKKFAELMM